MPEGQEGKSMERNQRRPGGAIATLALAASLVLGGCTTAPVPRHTDTALAAAGTSLATATDYLGQVRKEYRDAVAEQMARERNLSNGLIGAGALILGLATAKVHPDAILGTSLLAGTAYALGNRNLPRNRVLIYHEGLKALGCVERVAASLAPLEAIPTDTLRSELVKLTTAQANLGNELAAAEKLQPTAPAEEKARLATLQASASLANAAADKVVAAAQDRLNASAKVGRLVVAAVSDVDDAVSRAIIEDTPNLASVPGTIGGLRDMAGAFAPGIDLKIAVPAAPAPKADAGGQAGNGPNKTMAASGVVTDDGQKNKSSQPRPTPEAKAAQEANKKVEDATEALLAQARLVQQWTIQTTPPLKDDAFSGCGLAAAVPKLSASPAALAFKANVDARSVIDVQGGTPPYFAEWDGPTSPALGIKPPIRYDTRIEVTATATAKPAPLKTRLRITDSAPTPRPVYVDVSLID
ncbi:MAG: hypothetical protein J7603_14930 [Pseudacidovorax sp.]|nr:hypothetical protein [Pseudacidovorax sp.]